MNKNFLLNSKTAIDIYQKIYSLPIYDYHCHLSPKEIYEDKPFSDIGELLLSHDHYKWRLMRAAKIDESFITGAADYKSKFFKYAQAIQFAAGNPLYHWNMLEFSNYFGIDEALCESNAAELYERANTVIFEKQYSPRKLIEMSNVKYIATTDDITDSLEYHKLLENSNCSFKTVPSFRTDNLLLIRHPDYPDYIGRLSNISEIEIHDIYSLDLAIKQRLDFFNAHGCLFSDVGIPYFPYCEGDDDIANSVFKKALSREHITDDEYSAFLFRMYAFLGREYKTRGMVMQWHLSVQRNVNSQLQDTVGIDAGGDCINDRVPCKDIVRILDKICRTGGLPETVIYSLEPSSVDSLASIAYSFRNVNIGAAWWFCDHKDGIIDIIKIIARYGNIGNFLGMLTDSRSFLSYSRHDYFRRILCSVIAEWVDKGEFEGDAVALASAVCMGNIKALTERNISI